MDLGIAKPFNNLHYMAFTNEQGEAYALVVTYIQLSTHTYIHTYYTYNHLYICKTNEYCQALLLCKHNLPSFVMRYCSFCFSFFNQSFHHQRVLIIKTASPCTLAVIHECQFSPSAAKNLITACFNDISLIPCFRIICDAVIYLVK